MNYYFLHVGDDGPSIDGPYASADALSTAVKLASNSWDPAIDELYFITIGANGQADAYHVAIEEEWSEDGD